ncbi:MAG: hypothetical protein KBD66_03990 [Candidatus Doudnabacteria bacterium]|nr:hypothetical protein [Candidatus Doudnabacteria bacterium]
MFRYLLLLGFILVFLLVKLAQVLYYAAMTIVAFGAYFGFRLLSLLGFYEHLTKKKVLAVLDFQYRSMREIATRYEDQCGPNPKQIPMLVLGRFLFQLASEGCVEHDVRACTCGSCGLPDTHFFRLDRSPPDDGDPVWL